MRMAMKETTQGHPDRSGRRRPFATWVKKLAHFKASGLGEGRQLKTTDKKRPSKNRNSNQNSPYPFSGRTGTGASTTLSASASDSAVTHDPRQRRPCSGSQPSSILTPSAMSMGDDGGSRRSSYVETASDDGRGELARTGSRSTAPTISTEHDGPRSVTAPSNGAASSITGTTSRTATGGYDSRSRRGGDSTFSSPAPSMHSLATTLTTIQSMAPGEGVAGAAHLQPGGAAGGIGGVGMASLAGPSGGSLSFTNHFSGHNAQSIQFHQPFPSMPASAIPSHLTPLSGNNAGPGHPTTYTMATANNLLTDNASILTLASSSKRRRRRSLDTDASVRALAPSSLFGGSRESLPLSVLSANVDISGGGGGSGGATGGSAPTTPGLQLHTASSRLSVASTGLAAAAAADRNSIYSTTGILTGERSSLYVRQSLNTTSASASATGSGGGGSGGVGGGSAGDEASLRSGQSGLLGHAHSESMNGSIGSSLTNLLGSPRERETCISGRVVPGAGVGAVTATMSNINTAASIAYASTATPIAAFAATSSTKPDTFAITDNNGTAATLVAATATKSPAADATATV